MREKREDESEEDYEARLANDALRKREKREDETIEEYEAELDADVIK